MGGYMNLDMCPWSQIQIHIIHEYFSHLLWLLSHNINTIKHVLGLYSWDKLNYILCTG